MRVPVFENVSHEMSQWCTTTTYVAMSSRNACKSFEFEGGTLKSPSFRDALLARKVEHVATPVSTHAVVLEIIERLNDNLYVLVIFLVI